MRYNSFKTLGIFMAFALLIPQLYAQDTTGFIGVPRNNAFGPRVGWRESWFSGVWYNLSFVDKFGFTYRYYDVRRLPPRGPLSGENSAFLAAMGNFSTYTNGPTFFLLGYVEDDEVWCNLSPVLSPEYIHGQEFDTEFYDVYEIWFSWQIFLEELGPPFYKYEESYASHNFNIWGRLPPNKTVQVWYGVDHCDVYDRYIYNNMIIDRSIYFHPPVAGQPGVLYEDWEDYFQSGSGLWSCLGEFHIEGPEPPGDYEPPGWAECTFVDWVYPSGASAKNWLPEPNSIIGLKFKFHRDDVPARVAIRYNIYNISTWQGECMNFPVDAPVPKATGTGEFFDFTVVDSGQYDDIDTLDFDLYGGMRLNFMPENAAEIGSVRRYILTLSLEFPAGTSVIYHTLWLKAHDYGAKAIVSPGTGQTWRDLMRLRHTAFGQDVWSVSVPRDDDGQAFLGYNWGDFVADAWEEQMLGLPSPSGDSVVVRFVPFYQFENDTLRYADRDSIPIGRNIKGDGFCNWEEYRGFVTVGDQYGFYPATVGKQHKRLNPFRKEVMAHFMPGVEIRPEAPGYINALPDSMAYIVEHLVSLPDVDSIRLSLRRWVNINKFGAYYPYYASLRYWVDPSSYWTTNRPAGAGYQNAVVFWPLYRGDHPRLIPVAEALGYVRGWRFAFGDSCFIPNYVYQLEVNVDAMEALRDSLAYYANNDSAWQADRVKLIKADIAHELGHCIGMTDDRLNLGYLMGAHPPTDPNNLNKLILDPPDYTREYMERSKSEISIKEYPW